MTCHVTELVKHVTSLTRPDDVMRMLPVSQSCCQHVTMASCCFCSCCCCHHGEILGCVSGKVDEKRAPEADLRSVSDNTTHSYTLCQHCTSITRTVPLFMYVCSIFDDVGDYILSTSTSSKPPKDKERHRERDRDDDSKSRRHTHSYFEKPRGDEHQVTYTLTHTVTRMQVLFLCLNLSLSLYLSVCRWWKSIQVNNLIYLRLKPRYCLYWLITWHLSVHLSVCRSFRSSLSQRAD